MSIDQRSEAEIATALREAFTSFFVPLQRMQPVDVAAFEKLHAQIVELMRFYKGKAHVSKSLLYEVRAASKILMGELQHRPAEKVILEEMLSRLEMSFDLLLLGEVPEDRKPGVPRII
jgi:hypothetical protein